MARKETASLAEYLETRYEPECEYVDGQLLRRPEATHRFRFVKHRIAYYFRELEDACHVKSVMDQRVCVSQAPVPCYRVAEVCVVKRPWTPALVLHQPPLLVVEIIKPSESAAVLMGRFADLTRLGTRHIWAIEAERFKIYSVGRQGFAEAPGGQLPLPELNLLVNFKPFFKELD